MLLPCGCSLPHFPNRADAEFVDIIFNEDVFRRGGKGLIIIDEENDIPSEIKLHGLATFSDYEGKKYNFDINGASVFMLNPGEYKLENFKLYGKSGYWSSQVDYGNRYQAYFNIAVGDVIYLGKIETKILHDKLLQGESAPNRKEIVTNSEVKDDFMSLPPAFWSAIYKYAGKGITTKIMSWKDNAYKRNIVNE